ncbi:MAG: acylphosphatase [Chloroherpetonaceae bacterium]|nr:acylphosphatase [Chloroherpetonaceae bacterium]MDW8437188.1 acylphosphatase [Chloroherpetonaceae bacterium]
MLQRLHAIANGRVQGVGYRWFVQRAAERLGVKGWVRNLPDGTVELEAEGDSEALDALVTELKKGPIGASVREVKERRSTLQSDAERRYAVFEIRP